MSSEESELRAAARDYAQRVRRFKINLVAWVVGAVLLTGLWVLAEWNANGAFERFAHEGNAGDWNPTLWALAVGVWGLVVGIKGLRVHFGDRGLRRPALVAWSRKPPAATRFERLADEPSPRDQKRFPTAPGPPGAALTRPPPSVR